LQPLAARDQERTHPPKVALREMRLVREARPRWGSRDLLPTPLAQGSLRLHEDGRLGVEPHGSLLVLDRAASFLIALVVWHAPEAASAWGDHVPEGTIPRVEGAIRRPTAIRAAPIRSASYGP